jgi:threonine/homoserine/homoserine lactone efflux protein
MTLHGYWLFVLASFLLTIAPGPDMAFLLAQCVAKGRRAGILAALGTSVGVYVHLTAAVLGLSALLATSAIAFGVVKWLGAAYLIYLGVRAILNSRAASDVPVAPPTQRYGRTVFWQAFLSDVLNPKVAIFFVALLPQFIDAQGPHPTLQIILLGVTVNMVGLLVDFALVYFSGSLTKSLRRSPRVSAWLHRAMGAVFVALGLRLAAQKI